MTRTMCWNVVVAVVACLAGAAATRAVDCSEWTVGPGQRSAGPNGATFAALQWDPDGAGGPLPTALVVGGSFAVAGDALTNNIALWDGASWMPIGTGFNGTVRALTVYNNQLIAAGSFTQSGATTCNRIARWTGSDWQPLGVGVSGDVHCLAIYGGRLHAGGAFVSAGGVTANSVASWDGSIWRALGTGSNVGVTYSSGGNALVRALAVFNGNLIVGGDFNFAGFLLGTRAVAQWNGSAWSGLGAFPDSGGLISITCLGVTTFVAGQGENLYMGGTFSTAGGVTAQNIAKYNTLTGAWSGVAGGMGATVLQMFVFQFGGLHSVTISRSSLNGLGGGTYRFISTSGVWNLLSPQQANYYYFALSGNLLGGINGVSELIGSNWMPLGNGLHGAIRRMVAIGSDLYAAGAFTVADQLVVNGTARFDGTQWQALGAGPGMISVQTGAVFSNQFVVGGQVVSGATTTVRVSRWDGTNWITMGSLAGTSLDLLQVIDGSLYVAASGAVFRWNGLGWQAMASGPVHLHEFGFPDTVTALVSRSGVLYAAAGTILHELSGGAWVAIADQPPVPLDRFVVTNGSLIGAASFGGGPIYRWLGPGGTGWETLLSASTGSFVNTLAVSGGGVLHALVNNQLARLDGTQWTVLGLFAGGLASDILFGNGEGEIIVSGNVGTVDNMVSPMWARHAHSASADYNKSGMVSVQDIFDFLAGYFAGDPCADFNGSGTITVQDIFDYLSAYFAA